MRVFDETKTNELIDYDLEKGYLKADTLTKQIPKVAAITVEQKIKMLTAEGKEVVEINGNMYEVTSKNENGQTVSRIVETPAIPAQEEVEEIGVYIPYTEEELKKNAEAKYKHNVEMFIREKYSLSDEIAILRQRDSKPEEFEEYNNYAESCKLRAKEEMEEENYYEN